MNALLAFLLAISLLVAVHEFGHYWVARRLGVKVLKFSIGFGRPLLRWTRGADRTEYVLAWLPLGGFVQMLDEREGPVAATELHRAFNRQVLWRRSAIVAAGPLFNLLFAVLAYWLVFVLGSTGLKPVVGEVYAGSLAERAGIRVGDQWLAVAGKDTPTWDSVLYQLMASGVAEGRVGVRLLAASGDERTHELDLRPLFRQQEQPDILDFLGIAVRKPVLPAVLGTITSGGAAQRAGLQPGDRVLRVDGEPVADWPDWVKRVRAGAGQTLSVEIERDSRRLMLPLSPDSKQDRGETYGFIGAGVKVPDNYRDEYFVLQRFGPLDGLAAALQRTADLSWMTLRVIGKMLVGEVSLHNLSGPITIADAAGKTAGYGYEAFLKFLAVVSVSLGVLNLLPIPVLDGGHLVYFFIEWLRGAPLSEAVMEWTQKIGILLLAGLMALALTMDINRLLGGGLGG
jgi:regulator of sigma E protease